MWMSSVPLTASSAPGPKLRDDSVISRYRGSRVGFGGCRGSRRGTRSRRRRSPRCRPRGRARTRHPTRRGCRGRPDRAVPASARSGPRARCRGRPGTTCVRPGRRVRGRPPVAEEVEAERRRRQEIGPQALVIEALVTLDERRPRPRRVECLCREEVRAGLLRVVDRQAATDGSRRAVGSRRDRLRTDGVPVGLAPLRLVVAQPAAELGHRRLSRHVVVGFPAVRALELLPRQRRRHAERLERLSRGVLWQQ